jgi:hypothetical protein
MAFIRGRQPESVIWHHFRGPGDGFAFGQANGVFEARLLPNADRSIDLFLALLEYLQPAVDVFVHDWRTGERWTGSGLANADVRDAVARARQTLARSAGVEITAYGPDEQLSLTANLELFVYAETDRWLYLLQGKGLRRVTRLRPRSWRLEPGEFAESEESSRAVHLTVERLRLTRLSDTND